MRAPTERRVTLPPPVPSVLKFDEATPGVGVAEEKPTLALCVLDEAPGRLEVTPLPAFLWLLLREVVALLRVVVCAGRGGAPASGETVIIMVKIVVDDECGSGVRGSASALVHVPTSPGGPPAAGRSEMVRDGVLEDMEAKSVLESWGLPSVDVSGGRWAATRVLVVAARPAPVTDMAVAEDPLMTNGSSGSSGASVASGLEASDGMEGGDALDSGAVGWLLVAGWPLSAAAVGANRVVLVVSRVCAAVVRLSRQKSP